MRDEKKWRDKIQAGLSLCRALGPAKVQGPLTPIDYFQPSFWAAAPIGDEVLQNGEIFRSFVRPYVRLTQDKKMGRQDAKQKKGENEKQDKKKWRDEMRDKKKWGEETQDKKKWGDKTEREKNGEMRRKTKKMGRQYAKQTSSFEQRFVQSKGLRLNC